MEKDGRRQLSGVHDLKKVKEVVGLGYWVKLLGSYDSWLLSLIDEIHRFRVPMESLSDVV